MMRVFLVLMTVVFVCSITAEAGWLTDRLQQASKNVGDRIINDTPDSVYDSYKDAVTLDNKKEGVQQ